MSDRVKKKNLCRIIRSYAQHKLRGTSEEEIWEDIQKGSDIDYQPLFNELKEDTIKKVSKLLDANDYTRLIERKMRMTSTNWLIYDLILVHEDINVIGSTDAEDIPSALKILIFLVKKHGIEEKDADTVFDAWLNLYVDYNGDGRYCSPMLLQKRWYQTKTTTRTAFYTFWFKNFNNLKTAKEKPGALHIFVAKQFPSIITKPFVDWKKLYEKKMIMVLEQIDKVMGPNKHQGNTDADVLLVEPTIEVIDITDPEEDKVPNKETQQLTQESNEKEQPSATDVNKKSVIEDMNITIIDHEMYAGVDDADDDHLKTTENETNIEGSSPSQEVINSTESNLIYQKDNEDLPLEASKSKISVPASVDVDDVAKTNEVEKNINQYTGPDDADDDIPKTTEDETNIEGLSPSQEDERGSEHLPIETLNSTISVPENSTSQDSNLDDDDDIEILPEVDGLCNVKIIDATHIDQDFQESNKSLTDTTLSSHNVTEDNVCIIDEESQNKHYNDEIRMSQLEIVDDGIEFDEDDILLPIDNETSSHLPIDSQESHDDITQEDSERGIDSKLIMLPIVYTTKIDCIPILKDKSLDNLDLKDIENKIITQSKPQFKQNIDLIKSECVDIDDIIEHESLKSISPDPDNLYYCKYIRELLKVPRKRSYNPVLLCKNPDFNTRLRRLSAGFLSIVRNCKLLKTLKPLTIDLNKAFEQELVNGTLYVPKGVDEIGTCSNLNTKNHTTSALLPTAMHVQSLIDNSQPFMEDLYSSSMIYKIPSKTKNILSNDTEKVSNNITLLQYNSATTQVEKEISFDESKQINTVVKQAPNISAINSSAVDSVLDNYLNNLNKKCTKQNITDKQTIDDTITSNDDELLNQLTDNNSTNDTKDLAFGPSTVSDDVFNKQYMSGNQGPIESNNDYLNSLNKKCTKQYITDKQTIDDTMTSNDHELLTQLTDNNSTNDTKDLAFGPSTVSDDVFNKQYMSGNQGPIESNNDYLNNLNKKSIEKNISDKQAINYPMTSNVKELLAQIPENNSTINTKVSDDVLNKGGNQDSIECNNDNNQQNIISNSVEHQFEHVTITSDATVISENSTRKHDNQPMITVNNKKEKNKLKSSSKRLKTTNTPWYVHKPKKINYLEEDTLLTDCSLKRMLTALNALECEKPIEKQMPQLNTKSNRNRSRPSRAKPKQNSKCERKESFCCWTKMANSKSECQESNLILHPCGTDFSNCTCCCKYSYEEADSDKTIQHTEDKEETTSSVSTLLTEYKAGDINGITIKANTKSPKINLWAGKKTQDKSSCIPTTTEKSSCIPTSTEKSSYIPTTTENLSDSESIININDGDTNITSSENNSNSIIRNIVGNISIESNNGIMSIDGSIYNSTPSNCATLVKSPPQFNANLEVDTECTTFNSSVLQNTQSIESIDSNTNLFIIKPLTIEKSPIKLSENKILLTTANFDDYVSKTSSPSKFIGIENKEQTPINNYIDITLTPSFNEDVQVTYDFNVTDNNDVSLTPVVQENLLPNNINNEINLFSDKVSNVNNSNLKDAPEVTSNEKCDLESENVNEKQNEVDATIECLPATVKNNKKSILSDLMEMAGISAADTTYDNAISEPTQTANVSDSLPMLNVPTLSPVTTLSELKWALSHKAKFYSLNTKTGGLASIAIEIMKKFNNAPIVVSDDDDDHNYVKKKIQKNFKRVYINKRKELPMTGNKPRILKRRHFTNLSIIGSINSKIDNNVIDLDSSDDEKSKKSKIDRRLKRTYTVKKIINKKNIKVNDNEKLRNASSYSNDVEICRTIVREKNVTEKEIPENNESAQITLNAQRVSVSPMKVQTKNVESDESSDDEPLSKKVRIITPVQINRISPGPCLPKDSNNQQLESEIDIDLLSPPEVEDEEDFILGV